MNCWPSHQTLVVGDWLCRFAKGYSGRANSACVTRAGAMLSAEEIEHIESLYRDAGLAPSFRLSPLADDAIRLALEARGYGGEDGSVGMIAPAFAEAQIPELQLDPAPTAEWIAGACRWQTGAKRDTGALLGIVENIRVPARYATLYHGGQPAAYALATLDRGMVEFGSVMVDPSLRGLGLGRKLIRGIIGWAHGAAAGLVFLQAATENEIARNLYASLGFTVVYTAAYWRKH